VKTVKPLVAAVTEVLAVLGLVILLALAAFTLLDGLMRAVANRPIDLVREIGDLVAAVCGACCLPIVLLHRGNIVLRALDTILPAKAVRAVEVLAALVVEIVMIGMAWQFYLFSVKTMQAGDVTWLLNLPKAPFWFVVDAILWIAVMVQSFVLAEEYFGTREDASPEMAP
jgi:TRAP-type C4-dicarboxylate transport system permease small subunit